LGATKVCSATAEGDWQIAIVEVSFVEENRGIVEVEVGCLCRPCCSLLFQYGWYGFLKRRCTLKKSKPRKR